MKLKTLALLWFVGSSVAFLLWLVAASAIPGLMQPKSEYYLLVLLVGVFHCELRSLQSDKFKSNIGRSRVYSGLKRANDPPDEGD